MVRCIILFSELILPGDGLMAGSAYISFKIDYSVKADFQKRIQELGYTTVSEALRDSVEIITYNGERTPKEQVLARHLSRLQAVMDPEAAQKVWHDFCAFMEEYHYAVLTARMTEDEFAEALAIYQTDSNFACQFCHMHGYALIPNEIRDLLRHYYHDAEAIQLRREIITNSVKANAEEIPLSTLLSPAEQKKIARTTSL